MFRNFDLPQSRTNLLHEPNDYTAQGSFKKSNSFIDTGKALNGRTTSLPAGNSLQKHLPVYQELQDEMARFELQPQQLRNNIQPQKQQMYSFQKQQQQLYNIQPKQQKLLQNIQQWQPQQLGRMQLQNVQPVSRQPLQQQRIQQEIKMQQLKQQQLRAMQQQQLQTQQQQRYREQQRYLQQQRNQKQQYRQQQRAIFSYYSPIVSLLTQPRLNQVLANINHSSKNGKQHFKSQRYKNIRLHLKGTSCPGDCPAVCAPSCIKGCCRLKRYVSS